MDGGGWFDGDLNGDFEVKRCLSSFVDEGSIESHRYYLARRTLLEMLRDRGYSIPSLDIDISLQDFRSFYSQKPDPDRLRISASLRSDPSKKILVIFCGPDVVKVNAIRSIATQIVNKDSLSKLILVLQNHITSQALKAVDLFSFQVEKFQITDLLVNITKHVLKPKHRVLTDQEKNKLLKKYSLNEKQLPRMLQQDAIARYYGLEKGQVVKVIYNGEITGSHVTYRMMDLGKTKVVLVLILLFSVIALLFILFLPVQTKSQEEEGRISGSLEVLGACKY